MEKRNIKKGILGAAILGTMMGVNPVINVINEEGFNTVIAKTKKDKTKPKFKYTGKKTYKINVGKKLKIAKVTKLWKLQKTY